MEPVASRITEPLNTLARQQPDAMFDVVVRIRTETMRDAAAAYASIPDQLAAITRVLDARAPVAAAAAPAQDDARGESGASAHMKSPLLYRRISGSDVMSLAHDPALTGVPFQVFRERVQTADANDGDAFDAGDLVGRTVAEPLASQIRNDPVKRYGVIVVLDADHDEGRDNARAAMRTALETLRSHDPDVTYRVRERAADPYVFAHLTGAEITALLDLDRHPSTGSPAIFRIWEDTEVQLMITKSIATVKVDAAQIAYSALGEDIVWAVLDSGIDGTHPHFRLHDNLTLPAPLSHADFTADYTDADPKVNAQTSSAAALMDAVGHGTHVAGIIAGGWAAPDGTDKTAPPDPSHEPLALRTTRNEAGADERCIERLWTITGMAPKCKLLSMRIITPDVPGNVSSIIDAFDQIQRYNDYGRRIAVHGVNLSVGYPFDAKWFACGQSPLCVEVDRLVRSGVVVVVAAGNSGYGTLNTAITKGWSAGLAMTINDPGNAELAITVGSTHRDAPHRYGVSYFSSKGPTGDGRLKPDVVAPGERIVSCASKQGRQPATIVHDDHTSEVIGPDGYTYKEDSGTSMAAPHVSGMIAAFLSIRREYVGQPEDVKALFVGNATDLKRDRSYQGAGLVDLMRTIQAV